MTNNRSRLPNKTTQIFDKIDKKIKKQLRIR